ncbi:MAG TPA: bifunctional 3-(3-hydroxy-phenyl)propionate/3-hydroxycinnamic acid hydroxylase, partial [Sporichthyaceae bacterium]
MFDIAIVGYGPVGMTAAALLGQRGHRVVVLERYPGLYNLPRAALFDGETMRTWAALGVAEALLPKLRPAHHIEYGNGAGQTLLELELGTGAAGWAPYYSMYQPDLEDALDGLCRALPNVDVRLSSPVVGLSEQDDHVVLRVGPTEIPARYVVACDGGNSYVREHLGIDQDDYGFREPLLVCDFRLLAESDLPTLRQICDPRLPTALVALGHEHRRCAFQLLSEADFEPESRTDAVWRKAERHLRRDQAELIRVATYTLRSLIARSWRHGRVLLAGDAAHQMPPFLAQGMCSGVRDVQNLAFKLDLVLRGRCNAALLDTYQQEREPHVRWVVEKAIEIGRMYTLRDPVAVAERDRRMLAQREAGISPPPLRLPGLTCGVLALRDCPGRG